MGRQNKIDQLDRGCFGELSKQGGGKAAAPRDHAALHPCVGQSTDLLLKKKTRVERDHCTPSCSSSFSS